MQNQCLKLDKIVNYPWYFLIGSIIFLIARYGYQLSQLPDINKLPTIQWPSPVYIYTREGELISEWGQRRYEAIKIADVPKALCQAFLVTEDIRFFEHHGVDVQGLIRAAFKLFMTGRKLQGGSTITMQMVRNYYLTQEKTFLRKLKEILLSFKVEKKFTKDQILELYLNKIYMGHRTFGVGSAARFYFEKSLDQLSLSEIALLAGMPKSPAALNPITNVAAAKKRRNFVLYRLYHTGCINHTEYQDALEEAISIPTQRDQSILALSYVVNLVHESLPKILNQSTQKAYHVYTTVESQTQRMADQAIFTTLMEYDQRHGYRGPEKQLGTRIPKDKVSKIQFLKKMPIVNHLQPALVTATCYDELTVLCVNGESITLNRSSFHWILNKHRDVRKYLKTGDVVRLYWQDNYWRLAQVPKVQSALVALDPKNGAIKALSGGFSYSLSQFNRATQAARQVGSSFKPIIYAAAFEKGYNLSDHFNDAPLVFTNTANTDIWRPQNVNQSFCGSTPLRLALVTSINLPTIRLLEALGLAYVIKLANQFGFKTQKWPRNLSLALGSVEATPLEMAQSYSVFANGGYAITPYLIHHITDDQGHLVYQTHVSSIPHAFEKDIKKKENDLNKKALSLSRVLSEESTFLITSALKEVIPYHGAHIVKALGRDDVAGKTGTTNDTMDSWFIGYYPDLVSSVWIGYDQRKPLKEYAYTTALPLWVRFMKPVLQGTKVHQLKQPEGIIMLPICPESGLPIKKPSEKTIYEYFQKSTLSRYVVPQKQESLKKSSLLTDPLF